MNKPNRRFILDEKGYHYILDTAWPLHLRVLDFRTGQAEDLRDVGLARRVMREGTEVPAAQVTGGKAKWRASG